MLRSQLVSTALRAAARPSVAHTAARTTLITRASSTHAQESFEAFSERYVNFFKNAEDLFELQRGLNNCFAHDLVPSPEVVEAAVRAARRVNDYSTAVRIFEGIKEKVENVSQYKAYLEELKGVREELGAYLLFSVWSRDANLVYRCQVSASKKSCTRHHKRVYAGVAWNGRSRVRVKSFLNIFYKTDQPRARRILENALVIIPKQRLAFLSLL
jgi:cytochrome c oxidase subunit 5a